jgi:hypothetical protein
VAVLFGCFKRTDLCKLYSLHLQNRPLKLSGLKVKLAMERYFSVDFGVITVVGVSCGMSARCQKRENCCSPVC